MSQPRPTENLTALREAKKSSFFEAVARLGLQAAEALDYAHQVGVVHRDVKPANLLLDVQGTLWVTDFGLAQLQSDSGLTQPGDMLGTFRYMSPEQASGKAVVLDQRTDIYSLGLTLYELLTLERALLGETREQLLYQIGYVDPRPPRSIDPAIPPELETILAKAAAKEPAERYASARALADDLRRFLQNEPIRARPPSLRDRTVKWMRRHRPVVASAVVVLVLTAVGLLTSTILIAREQTKTRQAYEGERQQRARAEAAFQEARQAVDLFANVAADEMSDPGRMFEARKQLLDASLGYYQRFLAASQDDPAVGKELNAAQARIQAIVAEQNAFRGFARMLERKGLLRQQSVREALALRPTQAEAVHRLPVHWPWGAREEAEGGDPGRVRSPEEKREWFTAEATAGESEIEDILDEQQSKRLRQIAVQVRGLAALTDSELADELGLTKAQRDMVRDAQDRQREAAFALSRQLARRFAGRPRDDPERTREDAQLRRELEGRERAAVAEIVSYFDDGQRRIWQDLTGAPFGGDIHSPPRRVGRAGLPELMAGWLG